MAESRVIAEQNEVHVRCAVTSNIAYMGLVGKLNVIIGPKVVSAAAIESLSEQREKLKKHLAVFQEIGIWHEWAQPDLFWLVDKVECLRQQLRLTSYLIAKLKLIWRSAVSSSKKAVSERCFFVLPETHESAVSGPICGLVAGAFQTA